METVVLSNGMRVAVAQVRASVCTVSVTVNVGHINEPKLGIAALYEKMLLKKVPFVQAIYGGTITSFLTDCPKEELAATMEKMANLIKTPELSELLLDVAKKEIVERTLQSADMPSRQSKLAYKHTAFSQNNVVWDTQKYIDSVKSISLEDLKSLREKYYTGKNLVLCVAAQNLDASEIEALAKKYFEDIPDGIFHRVKQELYTGGYTHIPAVVDYQRVIFGWDVTSLSNVAEANVLMSALNGRLEHAFASTSCTAALKIAGYFGGMRTLRISVETLSSQKSLNDIIQTVAAIVKNLQTEKLDNNALESARQWAMTEKLFKFASPNDASVEAAWQILGREHMYNIDERIIATWRVSARDVQEIAQEIFSTPLTYVTYTNQPHYSYNEVVAMMH